MAGLARRYRWWLVGAAGAMACLSVLGLLCLPGPPPPPAVLQDAYDRIQAGISQQDARRIAEASFEKEPEDKWLPYAGNGGPHGQYLLSTDHEFSRTYDTWVLRVRWGPDGQVTQKTLTREHVPGPSILDRMLNALGL